MSFNIQGLFGILISFLATWYIQLDLCQVQANTISNIGGFSFYERISIYPRKAHSYFISGDGFRNASDFQFDEIDRSMNPFLVTEGSSIFVQTNYVEEFVQKIHPLIPCRYILITHNSDMSVPGIYKSLLDDEKIIAWFGENYDGYIHPKMHVLPMGLANSNWPNGKPKLFEKIRQLNCKKEHLLHMAFLHLTNPGERTYVFEKFVHAPFCFSRKPNQSLPKYLMDVACSKFELCPQGIALDTYRVWECLYLKTIPIVKSSPLDDLYQKFPILIVQNWDEVTEEFLNKKYEEMQGAFSKIEYLGIDDWLQLIQVKKKNEKILNSFLEPVQNLLNDV